MDLLLQRWHHSPSVRAALVSAAAVLCLSACGKGSDKTPTSDPRKAGAEVSAELEPPAPAAPAIIDPSVPALTINKTAQVSVLGYHDFITGKSDKDMKLNIDHFRSQLQALKDANLPVISMQHFLAWRRGEKDVPDPCVVITIDDGWKSVYQLAYPVLKEFGYPFTIYLYKKFVNGGSKSMTTAEIKEMMQHGCEIGSHSVSHKYKDATDAAFAKSKAAGDAFLRVEIVESRLFLEDLLGVSVLTYAYPGGYFSPREEEVAKLAGYEASFTVNPARVTWDSSATALHRFIIDGRDEKNSLFKRAVTSRGAGSSELVKQLLTTEGESLVKLSPHPDEAVTTRLPVISLDVSRLAGIIPESVVMKVAGFGQVPAKYDVERQVISCQLKERLRDRECLVHVSFKREQEAKPEVVSWGFSVDMKAAYLSEDVVDTALPEVEPGGER